MKQDSKTQLDQINETGFTQPPIKIRFTRTSSESSPQAAQPKRQSKRQTNVPPSAAHGLPSDALSLHGKIDKLELVLPRALMTANASEQAGLRLAAIPGVHKIRSKSDPYKLIYVLACPGGSKICFALIPKGDDMRFGVKITMNPSHMESEADVRALHRGLKQLFLPNWQDSLAAMLIQRSDHAYDVAMSPADLIIQQKGSPTESKFYIQSDRGGRIQTWYAGSIESHLHWLMYDQLASDAFKLAHGELPSRPKARDDAELVFEKSKVKGMTRFEARRVFDKPLTLREADAERNPLGNFDVYQVDNQKLASAPANFSLFLDSVRLHGVAGAGKQYLAQHHSREGKKQLAHFNEYLANCGAPWWNKSGLSSSIEASLKDKQIWHVLKHLAR